MKQILIVCLSFFIFSCAGIPTEALNTYKTSFNSFNATSDEFLVQFGQTIKWIKDREAEQQGRKQRVYQPYPKALPDSKPVGAIDPNVAEMRRALQVISKYNDTLTALAEGKSIEAVGNTASGLTNALNGLAGLTIAAPVANLVATVAQELERARLREEFRNALAKGAPIINQMFVIFEENIKTHYNNNVLFANERRTLIVEEIIDEVTLLQKLVKAHKAPAPDDKFKEVSGRQKALNNILVPISKEAVVKDAYPYPLQTNSTGHDWTPSVESNLTASIEQIQQNVESYSAEIDRINALAKSLTAYKGMLDTTKNCLDKLLAAGEEAPQLLWQAEYILGLAFQVKQNLAEIRRAEIAAR